MDVEKPTPSISNGAGQPKGREKTLMTEERRHPHHHRREYDEATHSHSRESELPWYAAFRMKLSELCILVTLIATFTSMRLEIATLKEQLTELRVEMKEQLAQLQRRELSETEFRAVNNRLDVIDRRLDEAQAQRRR